MSATKLERDLKAALREAHRQELRAIRAERQLELLGDQLLDHKKFWHGDVTRYRLRAEAAEEALKSASGDVL